MIKGAIILAVGYTAGYATALGQMPEIKASFAYLKKVWDEAEPVTEDPTPATSPSDTDPN